MNLITATIRKSRCARYKKRYKSSFDTPRTWSSLLGCRWNYNDWFQDGSLKRAEHTCYSLPLSFFSVLILIKVALLSPVHCLFVWLYIKAKHISLCYSYSAYTFLHRFHHLPFTDNQNRRQCSPLPSPWGPESERLILHPVCLLGCLLYVISTSFVTVSSAVNGDKIVSPTAFGLMIQWMPAYGVLSRAHTRCCFSFTVSSWNC